jgi:hypothetical protein
MRGREAHPHADLDPDGYSDICAYANGHADGYGFGYTHRDLYAHADRYVDRYADTDRPADGYAHDHPHPYQNAPANPHAVPSQRVSSAANPDPHRAPRSVVRPWGVWGAIPLPG